MKQTVLRLRDEILRPPYFQTASKTTNKSPVKQCFAGLKILL